MTKRYDYLNWSLLLGGCALAWISVLGGVLAWAPWVQAKWFPPVRDLKITDVERHGRAVCWNTTLRKVSAATLVRSGYWVDYGDGARDQVIATLDGSPMPIGTVVEPGTTVTLGPFCVDLPIRNGHVLVDVSPNVSTLLNVRVYHANWWDVVLTTPPFEIPKEPVIRYDNGRNIDQQPCSQCHKNNRR